MPILPFDWKLMTPSHVLLSQNMPFHTPLFY
jgi:hypothetical protein